MKLAILFLVLTASSSLQALGSAPAPLPYMLSGFEDLKDKPVGTAVLVDWFAPWCGDCMQIMPKIHELENEKAVEVRKINIDKNPAQAEFLGIKEKPRLYLFVRTEKGWELKDNGDPSSIDRLQQGIRALAMQKKSSETPATQTQ